MVLLVAVQWLHVLAGIVWMGSQVVTALVIWPALLSLGDAPVRRVSQALARPAMRLMGPAGFGVLVLGLLRGTWLGPVQSFKALGTAYGLTFLAALLLTFLLMAHGGRTRRRMEEVVWDGEQIRAEAAAFLQRDAAIQVGVLSAIVGCMVLMRMGL